jgi:hypothetical protein
MDEQASREPPAGGGIPQIIALIALTGVLVAIVGLPKSTNETTSTPGTPTGPPSAVSVHGSTTEIRPALATPPGAPAAHLVAARNEFESFQVAVEGGDGRDGVRVGLRGAGLTGPDGADIPAADVTIYREAPYYANFASDAEGDDGYWYDALIPERDPYYGEDRNAFPYDIPANGKLVAWVDVLVPGSAPAGVYRGELAVTQRGGSELVTVPVRLRVIDFSMPSTSSLRSLFLSTNEFQPDEPCLAHDAATCGPDDQRGWLLHYLYSRAGLENRVTVANPSPVRTPDFSDPAQRELFHRFAGPLIDGAPAPPPGTGLQSMRLSGARLTTLWAGLGEDCFGPCLDGWRRLLGDDAFRDRFVYYACDEPHDDPTEWANCAAKAAGVGGQAPILVTATLADAVAQGATGYVNILVPNVIHLVPGEASFADGGPGRELWAYTACDSHGCGPDTACAAPESPTSDTDGWPGYVIDEPPSQARAMGWLAYEEGATGELYYSATWSLDTAWTEQCVFGGNGDGNLFYPGRPEGYAGSTDSVIGGTTDIPIESIRLKRIRDGREDYEYLHELEARGEGEQAQAAAEGLLGAPDVAARGATFTQEELDSAREQLVNLLDP